MILEMLPNEKNIVNYLNKTKELGMNNDHIYFINNRGQYISQTDCDRVDVEFVDFTKLSQENMDLMLRADKIIFHGLFYKYKEIINIYRVLMHCSAQLVWVVWGGDFYNEYRKNNSLLGFLTVMPVLKEHYRRILISKFNIIVSGCDFEAISSVYKVKATKLEAQYPYELINCECNFEGIKTENLNILVGHSATKTCRHVSVLKKIHIYNDKIGFIYCPLSYPRNSRYIQRVIKTGNKLFGDKFVPIIDFMDYIEYCEFLNKIDIGIFDNDRQQGMGNIVNLLYLGKKVFISEENTINKYFHEPSYAIFYTNSLNGDNFCTLKKSDAIKNHYSIIKRFSDEQFKEKWEQVYMHHHMIER
ncbi:TDP-N-acetylfucosamine:lipid II N-acetylfucosaminyltransferase [Faecalibaculum rodentium]|uniref:TDP-N-acetylfucosamine:lipid II N-acetylfucosaminyltransferase n=1 Tax=Faecalibaculum rodentium TaxID=1702221 RepID=UPI001C3C4925|nr:TDP-N-acetylfucosamine:lipid II N-acetylfucosaminyltransferase [Faecalibaculum rodentium]